MAFAGQDFSVVGIGSVQYLSFDYSLLLQPNETILNAAWQASLSAGTDPAPQGIISGIPVISGTIVSQLIDLTNTANVKDSNFYLLVCNALTSLGQSLLVWAHMPVQSPA